MLSDKVVLVTGASRGIGRAIALLAAENNATVIINYNSSHDHAEEVVSIITKIGLKADLIKADVSNESEVKQMFKTIKEKYSRLDILVNNAGIMKDSLLMLTKTDSFEQLVNVNCKGTFLCTREASRIMMKQKSGKIINLASIVGTNGNRGQSVYSGSKSFIVGFTKSIAKELGTFGITVNAISPGAIETDLIADYNEEIKIKVEENIALGRIGTPNDVAKVALFLSSDLANYVSGQIIGVDGCQIM